MTSASRVVLLALASRVLVLGLMMLADWTFADLDSSARLQGYPCAGQQASEPQGELRWYIRLSRDCGRSPGSKSGVPALRRHRRRRRLPLPVAS